MKGLGDATIRARKQGFTLLELLVVLAILGVVTGLGTSAFVTVTAVWNETKSLTDLDAQAEEAFRSIGRDLSDTLSYDLSKLSIVGTRQEIVNTNTVPAAHDANDTVAVPIQGASLGRTRLRAAMVGYRVDRDLSKGSLIRTQGDLDGKFPTTGQQNVLPLAHTIAFRVEYLSDESDQHWLAVWHGPGHPEAIRVSLVLEDPDRPDFQISRKKVFRIHVR